MNIWLYGYMVVWLYGYMVKELEGLKILGLNSKTSVLQ